MSRLEKFCTLETMTDSARVNVQLVSLGALAHMFDRTSIMGKENCYVKLWLPKTALDL